MRKQAVVIPTLFLIIPLFLAGCDDANKRSYNYSFEQRYITITTEPAGAAVTLLQPFGQRPTFLGKTPLTASPVAVMTRLNSVKNVRVTPQAYATYLGNAVVRIERDGYESFYGPLKTDPNETIAHHIELPPLPDSR